MRHLKVGLIGLGHVGRGFLELVRKTTDRLEARAETRIDVLHVLDRSFARKSDFLQGIPAGDSIDPILNNSEIDVVVELIGGIEPAYSYIRSALEQGKSVVTANKALLAKHGNELFQIARDNKQEIAFEAAVAAALPVVKNLRRGLVATEIDSIHGILNGTCNFIISRMDQDHMDYADALRLAQERGFAEADPTFDVEGMDAAQKLAIITAIAFDTAINEDAVVTTGITGIRRIDLELAHTMDCVIRLLAVARREPLQMRVMPAMLPRDHVLASIQDENNAVLFQTREAGPQLIMGQGAGPLPTASAVISDLIYLSRKEREWPDIWISGTHRPEPFYDYESRYYLRFQALDRPGVMAEVARALADHSVSIASLHQQEGPEPVDVVVMTHTTHEKSLREALDRIDGLPFIAAPTVAIPFEKRA